MKKEKTSTLHPIPDILLEVLRSKTQVCTVWNTLTPLAKNEWICWITSAKKEETVIHRRDRFQVDLLHGKRRPCCWPGCPHRGRTVRLVVVTKSSTTKRSKAIN